MSTAISELQDEAPPINPALVDKTGKYKMALDPYLRHVFQLATAQGPDALLEAQHKIGEMLRRMPLMRYRPLPAARRFHMSNKPLRFAIGGNRSSKSESLAHEVVWLATGMHPWKRVKVPNVGWYCCEQYEMIGSILYEKLKRLLRGIKHQVVWHNARLNIPNTIFIPVIDSVTGEPAESRIIFKTYQQGPETFQGTERQWIANDEQFPENIFQEQISRIGPGDPLLFMAAMTPIKPQPWLEDKINQMPETWDVISYPLLDNRESVGGFIPDHTIWGAVEEWAEETRPTRMKGIWGSYLGVVYTTFSRNFHVIPERLEHRFLSKGFLSRAATIGAIDWGGANPFAFLFAVRIPQFEDAWYIYDEYVWEYRTRGVRLIKQHADEIKRRCAFWCANLERTWADHDRQDRYEIENCGIPTLAALKDDRNAGIESVQKKFNISAKTGRAKLYIAERCRHLIKEVATLRWPNKTEIRDPQDNPVKKDDHAENALEYLIHSERMTTEPPEELMVYGNGDIGHYPNEFDTMVR